MHRFERSYLLGVALVALVSLAGCSQESPVPDTAGEAPEPVALELPPEDGNGLNLLLITIDTLRADHLGTYGYAPPTSPAIDALASEGTVFEQTFAPRGVTWPSLGTLMTARYPIGHGVRNNGVTMSNAQTTLAEILSAKGYESTALVSVNALHQNWEGFGEKHWFKDPATALYAAEWLREPRDTPFFLWVHLLGPHKPYTPPEEYEKRFSPNYTGPFKGSEEYVDPITFHQKELEEADLDHIIALYDGLVARSDDLVQHILGTLESLDLDDNTLVVFASDHGDDLYDHNKYFYHLASVYDSVLHVPLIFRLPGVVPKSLRVDAVTELMDVAPTILELLGFSAAPAFHGESLAPFFRGESVDLGAAFGEWKDRILTVRTDRYRYVLNPTGYEPVWFALEDYSDLRKKESYQRLISSGVFNPSLEQFDYPIGEVELYDLSRDPSRPVENLEDYAEDIGELNMLLQDWQQINGWEFLGGAEEHIDPEVQEMLEGLGYVF